jgi:hypothetical protein
MLQPDNVAALHRVSSSFELSKSVCLLDNPIVISLLPPVSSLCDVVRDPRSHDPCEAHHIKPLLPPSPPNPELKYGVLGISTVLDVGLEFTLA